MKEEYWQINKSTDLSLMGKKQRKEGRQEHTKREGRNHWITFLWNINIIINSIIIIIIIIIAIDGTLTGLVTSGVGTAF
jgi:hypothetical protein